MIIYLVFQSVSNKRLEEQMGEGFLYSLSRVESQISGKMEEAVNLAEQVATNNELQFVLKRDATTQSVEQFKNYLTLKPFTRTLESAYYSHFSLKIFISDPILYSGEGRIFDKLTNINKTGWYEDTKDSYLGKWLFGAVSFAAAANGSDSTYSLKKLNLCRSIRYQTGGEFLGLVLVSFEDQFIDDLLGTVVQDGQASTFLLDEFGQVMLSDGEPPEGLKDIFTTQGMGFKSVTLGGMVYLTARVSIENTPWTLFSITPYNPLVTNKTVLSGASFLTVLIYIILSNLLVLFFYMSFLRRISTLGNSLKNSVENQYSFLIGSPYKDELGQVENQFDQMCLMTKELISAVYDSGVKAKESELKALQAQVNPHFLYNTLDMINWMAVDIEAYNISDMVTALGKFFRMVLSGGGECVDLRSELELLRQYVYIQQARLKDMLEVKVDIPENLMDYAVVKLTLQPIVENCIKHGFSFFKEVKKGKIFITGRLAGDNLVLEITDNGRGVISSQQPDSNGLINKTYYGLEGIRERLRLYFGEESSVELEAMEVGAKAILSWRALRYNEYKKM